MYSPEVYDKTNKSTEELVDLFKKQTIEIDGYLNNKNFLIRTNQEKGIITIIFTELNCSVKITLHIQNVKRSIAYNYIFRTITSNFSKSIDISYYPEGTYYLKIQIADNLFIQKLLIQ